MDVQNSPDNPESGDWVPERVLLLSLEDNSDTKFYLLGGEKWTVTDP